MNIMAVHQQPHRPFRLSRPWRKPQDVAAALKRAIARVKAGQPALVDTITQKR